MPSKYSSSFQEYLSLLIRLHHLAAERKHESEEADAVRDEMDGPWYKMTDEEQVLLRCLSADLWTILEPEFDPAPDADSVEAFKEAVAGDRLLEVTLLLGEHPALCRDLEGAQLRERCWIAHGVPEAAALFHQQVETLR